MFEAIRRWFNIDDTKETVTVEKGESLWQIAEDITGDGNRWRELADANPDRGWDAQHTIHPGEELKLPETWR